MQTTINKEKMIIFTFDVTMFFPSLPYLKQIITVHSSNRLRLKSSPLRTPNTPPPTKTTTIVIHANIDLLVTSNNSFDNVKTGK